MLGLMSINSPVHQSFVQTLDLNFRGLTEAIAAYLIPHPGGAILIESGPGSTISALQSGLKKNGFNASDVTDVLLTHIHLDHAGASGWLAQQGARIHVHPAGASHLLNPEKLVNSATRIYGDWMQILWGDFLPLPEDRLSVVQDGDQIDIDGLHFTAIDTPGHANHHLAYIFVGICFSGDIGGVRMRGAKQIRLPMPPPDLNLETWFLSINKLKSAHDDGLFQYIAPTHFGIFDNVGWHLETLLNTLQEINGFIWQVMPTNPTVEELNNQFITWTQERTNAAGIEAQTQDRMEVANPSWMTAQGIYRYWHKVINPS